jgi:hypothetical protein
MPTRTAPLHERVDFAGSLIARTGASSVDLLCTNGSVIRPAPAGDPSGTTNTVTGTNTCF